MHLSLVDIIYIMRHYIAIIKLDNALYFVESGRYE